MHNVTHDHLCTLTPVTESVRCAGTLINENASAQKSAQLLLPDWLPERFTRNAHHV